MQRKVQRAFGFENGLHRDYLKERQAKENKATYKGVERRINTKKPKKQSSKETWRTELLYDLHVFFQQNILLSVRSVQEVGRGRRGKEEGIVKFPATLRCSSW